MAGRRAGFTPDEVAPLRSAPKTDAGSLLFRVGVGFGEEARDHRGDGAHVFGLSEEGVNARAPGLGLAVVGREHDDGRAAEGRAAGVRGRWESFCGARTSSSPLARGRPWSKSRRS